MDAGDDVTGSETRIGVHVKGVVGHMTRKRWENNLCRSIAHDEKGKERL
jgi:ribosomal protein L28